ncbi:MAG: FAD-dependent oxidoreductase [Bacteroidales bacterium]|nr:FAD-dependent oxidoreductase [Bacteroidales bacterium]
MMFFLSLCSLWMPAQAQRSFDLVIAGGTPGGIMTAIAAAREGKTSVILERTAHIGGLPANGLGATDIATRGATTGLFREFVDRVLAYYTGKYGADSEQVKACSGGYHFEPSVAGRVFSEMIAEHGDKITVLTMRQLDAMPRSADVKNDMIVAVRVLNRQTGQTETYTGKIFADATYEGDLAAAAQIPFRTGREARREFKEPGAGQVYKFWGGEEQDVSSFEADNAVQAYNYRLCLTKHPENRLPVARPDGYSREEYASLADDVWTGRHTGVQMKTVTPAMMEENRRHIAGGNPTKIPGDPWGISKITNTVALPNAKTDANNQHLAFISTDLPEENWAWATSGWDWRDRYAERLKNYTLGLIWFAQNDKALPEHFRKACGEWGLAKDEYVDNGNFPRQVYVREGRRFEGEYFFTANDALPVAPGKRPPVHAGSITASHYALDSHAVRKREPGRVHLDGFLSYPTAVYTVPFGVIVPKGADNLLIPVPVSGSHIGFSTLRMEPCWMAMGQAAGIAASVAIDHRCKIRNVDVAQLQDRLLRQNATLMYFRDLAPDSPHFTMAQYMGLRGYLPDWNARLDEPVDAATAALWQHLSGMKTETGASRGETLTKIYAALYE